MSDRAPDEMVDLVVEGTTYRTRPTAKYLARKPVVLRDPRRVVAHIPGKILEVLVSEGQTIEQGAGVVVLEAMKMQNSITATAAGTVKRLHVEPGRLVAKGDLLAEIG